jgi:hypothetical protein
MMASIQPVKRNVDLNFMRTAKSIKDGIYSHESFENLYLVDKSAMDLYFLTLKLLIT